MMKLKILENKYLRDRVKEEKKLTTLFQSTFTAVELWQRVEPDLRLLNSKTGQLIIDDFPPFKEDLNFYKHIEVAYRQANGDCVSSLPDNVGVMGCFYYTEGSRLPVTFEFIEKEPGGVNLMDEKEQNPMTVPRTVAIRIMLEFCSNKDLIYQYVLADSRFATIENMLFIKLGLAGNFIMAVNDERAVALNVEDQMNGNFVRVDSLQLEPDTAIPVYLEGCIFPVLLVKSGFRSNDIRKENVYLICSNVSDTPHEIMKPYFEAFQGKIDWLYCAT